MAVLLPYSHNFTNVGSFDIKGGSSRTLYAWGDFAGGVLSVQAVIPHEFGEEVFDLTNEAPYVEQEIADVEPEVEPSDEEPLLELRDKGYLNFTLRAPIIRISLLDCETEPDVRIWLG